MDLTSNIKNIYIGQKKKTTIFIHTVVFIMDWFDKICHFGILFILYLISHQMPFWKAGIQHMYS